MYLYRLQIKWDYKKNYDYVTMLSIAKIIEYTVSDELKRMWQEAEVVQFDADLNIYHEKLSKQRF
jgi:hypothetical protein